MEPINYNIDVQTPFQAALQGYQAGAGIRDDRIKLQQQQALLDQQRRSNEVIQSLISNPNAGAADYANATLLVPGMKEQFKQSWDMRNTDQQQTHLNEVGQYFSAVKSGRPDIASEMMRRRADAFDASGDQQQAQALRSQADVVEQHPEFARTMLGMMLSSLPGGDKVVGNVVSLGAENRAEAKAPAELRQAEASADKTTSEAESAAVAAKFAESNAAMDLQKKGWDIKALQADMDVERQNVAIAAMNARTARETNDLKREENQLKLQELITKRDETVRAKAAEIESARSNMDNMLNTADRILNTPMDVIGSAAGPVSSRIVTTSQDTADFEALVETLGSQAFMAQIPNIKGMGALSNAEGEKLQAALQNFSLKQSPERLVANVKEAQRLILKARSNLATRYGVKDTVPDTPAVQPSPADVDALVKKYGGGN